MGPRCGELSMATLFVERVWGRVSSTTSPCEVSGMTDPSHFLVLVWTKFLFL